LEIIEFPKLAEYGNLPDVAINGLLLMNGPLYLLIYLVAVYVMSHYQLDRKRHGEILIALEKRRELKESEELDCAR
jgi:Na+/melibiose symporter-like transporter